MFRRIAIGGVAAAIPLAGLSIGALAGPAVAAPDAPAEEPITLTSPDAGLSVNVSPQFPQIVDYEFSGATIDGNNDGPLTSMVINGKTEKVSAEVTDQTDSSATWHLTFADLPDVSMDAEISLTGEDTVHFAITKVNDSADSYVKSIAIPGLDLVSVNSSQPGAHVAAAKMSIDRNKNGDTQTDITADTEKTGVLGAAYVIVNTDDVAVAMETNAISDDDPTANQNENRWQRQITEEDGNKELSVWSGEWTYRSDAQIKWGDPTNVELPYTDIKLTADRNGDGAVTWQDGAIAFRDIMIDAVGADEVPSNVITHIPFNFASLATHPFLRTLDDVKRINEATDGLGQHVLLKGYGSEGHDSAHPDYGGNYNVRAGGLKDLNTLVNTGHDWNARFGVHVNTTEVYPEAHSFGDVPYDESSEGWSWLDQSYYLNQRQDLVQQNGHNTLDRFSQLKQEVPGLDFVYIDVYYSFGWRAEALAQGLQKLGLAVASEWSGHFQRYSTWSHWAADENYGGDTDKGINSQIFRFIANQRTDTWNPDPILGNAQVVEFEGWTGQKNWNNFYNNIWQQNLPNKFLQHFPITKWDGNTISFGQGDTPFSDITASATNASDRTFKVGDAVVLKGKNYLLPWTFDGDNKLYHYNAKGGSSTWDLPAEFDGASTATVYQLSQSGQTKVGTVDVSSGKFTFDAEAATPYVVYLDSAPKAVAPDYGQGSGIADPGFNNGDLSAYQSSGNVSVKEEAGDGQINAVFGSGEASISQNIDVPKAGKYSAWAFVQVEPGKTRPVTLSVDGSGVKAPVSNVVQRSTAKNWVAASEKNNTYFQRVRVVFDATGSGDVTLKVAAADGDATVKVDDLRFVEFTAPSDENPTDETVFFNDFEHQDKGWYPFVKGNAGNITDPRTHLSELNAPFTQKGWNKKAIDDVLDGKWSLKSHSENGGLVYRTVPQNVEFEPGHKYRVSFDYQSTDAGAYKWVTGYDSTAGEKISEVRTSQVAIPAQTTTKRYNAEFNTAACGDYWVGVQRVGGGGHATDFVMDNFRVEDLGTSDEVAACAELNADGASSLVAGSAATVNATVSSREPADATDVTVSASGPDGWELTADGSASADSLASGADFATAWKVTAPKGTDPGNYDLTFTATYTIDGQARSVSTTYPVKVLEPLPDGSTYISDMDWQNESNGWGPIERDMEVGDSGAGDGGPITLDGKEYAKGVGMNSPGSLDVNLNGSCTVFEATVGLDDTQASVGRGSVGFEVYGDGELLAQTDVFEPGSSPQQLSVDITGVKVLTLKGTDGGDGPGNDHADWGDALVQCGDDSEGSDDSNASADDSANDNGTADDEAADNGSSDDEAADNGTADDEAADNGTADDEAGDNGTASDEAADQGTSDDEAADNGTADDKATDQGTSDDEAADNGTADDKATDQGTSDDEAADNGTADDEAADQGTADDKADAGSDKADTGSSSDAAAAHGADSGSSAANEAAEAASAGSNDTTSTNATASSTADPGDDLPDTGANGAAITLLVSLSLFALAAGAVIYTARRRNA